MCAYYKKTGVRKSMNSKRTKVGMDINEEVIKSTNIL